MATELQEYGQIHIEQMTSSLDEAYRTSEYLTEFIRDRGLIPDFESYLLEKVRPTTGAACLHFEDVVEFVRGYE
ncbi:hypothetical protein D3C77_429110 [compost metagenome]